MGSFDYEQWSEKYHNVKRIDLFMYFNDEEKEILNKFDITLEDKLYTENEFDVIDEKLILYYKNEAEMSEEELEECIELPEGVTREQFDNLLKIMDRVRDKYEF